MDTKTVIISIFFCFYPFLNNASEKKRVTFALIEKINKIDQYDGPASDLWYSEEDEKVAKKKFLEEKALSNEILNVSDQLQNTKLHQKNLPLQPKPTKKAFFGFDDKN